MKSLSLTPYLYVKKYAISLHSITLIQFRRLLPNGPEWCTQNCWIILVQNLWSTHSILAVILGLLRYELMIRLASYFSYDHSWCNNWARSKNLEIPYPWRILRGGGGWGYVRKVWRDQQQKITPVIPSFCCQIRKLLLELARTINQLFWIKSL